MKDLKELRDQIDVIDRQIVDLYQERMEIAAGVAEYKINTGKKVFDKEREDSKLATLTALGKTDFNKHGIRELFEQIMSMSRKRQYQLLTAHGMYEKPDFTEVESLDYHNARIVFQGTEGAYSQLALREYFGEQTDSYHVETWRDAMEAIAGDEADYAVLPIENSTEGIVTDIYDLLTEYQLYIVGEQGVKVEHVLLGIPETSLDEIKTVYSHPQALAQCKKYLESHPDWKIVKTENTAGAAKKVHEEMNRSQAAIASRAAGELYGLSVMAENICYNDQNVTRFIIVSAHPVYEKSAAKVSVCFELPHESGTLYNMLSHFIYNGLSMTKIESRPITGKKWEYRFFVDFEGNLEEPAVKNALRGLEAEANRMRVLGNYGQQEEQ